MGQPNMTYFPVAFALLLIATGVFLGYWIRIGQTHFREKIISYREHQKTITEVELRHSLMGLQDIVEESIKIAQGKGVYGKYSSITGHSRNHEEWCQCEKCTEHDFYCNCPICFIERGYKRRVPEQYGGYECDDNEIILKKDRLFNPPGV